MTCIALTVNGKPVAQTVEPRTNLADFLREHLMLTGTHVGCEHGICGACTVVINGEIARSCITYAVACDGADIRTIESFDDDPLMQKLRQAFAEEHALQCGYCTPGMLIAARDTVRRNGPLSAGEIRNAMSGNLCRCTGYMGIVEAIEKVAGESAEDRAGEPAPTTLGPAPGPDAPDSFMAESAAEAPVARKETRKLAAPTPQAPAGSADVTTGEVRQEGEFTVLTQTILVGRPADEVWRYMADIEKVAGCMPGVTLDGPPQNGHVTGKLGVKLGPIQAEFAGEAEVERMEAERRSVIDGKGRDMKSASRAKGRVEYKLQEAQGGAATRIDVAITYSLAGRLAQFSRGSLVRDLVSRIAGSFAQTLEARLSGREDAEAAPARLDAGSLVLSVFWEKIRSFFTRLFGRRG